MEDATSVVCGIERWSGESVASLAWLVAKRGRTVALRVLPPDSLEWPRCQRKIREMGVVGCAGKL